MTNDLLIARAQLLRQTILADYAEIFREPDGHLKHPFLVPGSNQYAHELWDWDSWLSSVALGQILAELNCSEATEKAAHYQRGCVLNFLSFGSIGGWLPFVVQAKWEPKPPETPGSRNMHKPVLAQHAAFLTRRNGGDAEWLRERFPFLQTFLGNYRNHHRHQCGLYFWQTDSGIGVDNDPCTFFRPPRSSGSIYLNCLMFKELLAAQYLCECLGLDEVSVEFARDAAQLKAAIQEHCWDERDGFFYSVDLNLLPNENVGGLHEGAPRHWDCLIQRIGVWSGFLALWAGIATPEQAERMVAEHYRDTRTFHAPFGVRTLSKMEKMYSVRGSGNPSNWLGPIWGIANYLTFRGLVAYGYHADARDLAEKTVHLFGRDLERFGALHEYYQPDNGEPVMHRGFQNWNYLVLNMMTWLENREVVTEW